MHSEGGCGIIRVRGGERMAEVKDLKKEMVESVAKDLGVTSEPKVAERRITDGKTLPKTPTKKVESVEVDEKDSTPVAQITELTVSYRISPKGIYSSAEISKTVQINTDNREVVNGIVEQMKAEVLEDTLQAAHNMVEQAMEKGMI